jgi:hypothetical protein
MAELVYASPHAVSFLAGIAYITPHPLTVILLVACVTFGDISARTRHGGQTHSQV